MRLIYYVPDNMSIDDYKSEWEQVVAEVHHGLSPNIEDYVKDPTKAQVVEIPEYRKAHIPINAASKDFIQYVYVDEYDDIVENTNIPEMCLVTDNNENMFIQCECNNIYKYYQFID